MKSELITAVILAGGESRRMGRPKAEELYRGKALVEHAREALEPLWGPGIVMTRNEQKILEGWVHVQDERPGLGPLEGIRSALNASPTPWIAVLACDLPQVPPELFQFLAKHLHWSDVQAVIPLLHTQQEIQPLAGFYAKTLLPRLSNFIDAGGRKVLDFTAGDEVLKVAINEEQPFYAEDLFHNVNRPDDLR